MTNGLPVTAAAGLTPRLPLIVVEPVLVTPWPDSTAKLDAVPSPTGAAEADWLETRLRTTSTSAVSAAEADAYFATRGRDSRLGAWASQQSEPIGARQDLLDEVERVTQRFGDAPPRPPNWGGYRIAPLEMEFWADGPFRLHDRFRWRRPDMNSSWTINRLSP